ncbi:MAG: hypothetical protein IH950_01305 [Bacteroidetes bacterium]|nr:hypothetical protein [Bacteroidota bacterium]
MKNEYLRHILATINYRFQKSVRNSEIDFGDFSAGKGSRTPNEIINHMYYVLSAARIYILEEQFEKEMPEKLNLKLEIDRFNSELRSIDKVLANNKLGINFSKRLLQGPFSDILIHIGQISMLRRLSNDPIEGEDFSSAHIKTGTI